MDEYSQRVKLQTAITAAIAECEEVCFEVHANQEVTQQARIRRTQLIAVREFIDNKRDTL